MKASDVVEHSSFGRGTVISVRSREGSAVARVDFGYMVDWVSAEDIEVAVEAPELSGPGTRHVERESASGRPYPKALPANVVDARRGILALRLGQVSRSDVRALSAGTGDVETGLESVVADALKRRPGAVLLEGAWGSGKTHLLTMLDAIASDNGMASSAVILDGDRICLSDPMGLLGAIVGSLRYPEEPAPNGLRGRLPQFRRMAEGWRPHTSGGLMMASAIRAFPRSAFDDPDALDVLEDYLSLDLAPTVAAGRLRSLRHWCPRPPAIKAWRVAERAPRFGELLAGWAELVARTGGRGLLAIIDELDVEYASTMGWGQAQWRKRERRAACLEALRTCLSSDAPLVVAFGSAPGADGDDDPELDLRRRLGRGGRFLEVQAPQPDLPQTRTIGTRALELYEQAWPERIAGVDRNWLADRLDRLAMAHIRGANPVPRNFIRRALELFDIAPEVGPERTEPTA